MAENKLFLINHGLTDMDHLDIHKNLINLSLRGNKITRITNLLNCFCLKSLDLSMNGITKITGIESLQGLVNLNLSFNNIELVENIGNLHCLIICNLSFNKITNLSGFKELKGPNYKLEILDLRGNLIGSLEHLLSCLKPCRLLHHLMLTVKPDSKESLLFTSDDETFSKDLKSSSNPICFLSGLRYSIFSSLINLVSLDGTNRSGDTIEVGLDHLKTNEKEDLQVHFTTSESSDLDKFLSTILYSNNIANTQSTAQYRKELQTVQHSLDSGNNKKMANSSNDKNILQNEALKQIAESLGEKFLKIIDDKLSENLVKVPLIKNSPSKIPVLKKLNKGSLETLDLHNSNIKKKISRERKLKQARAIHDDTQNEDSERFAEHFIPDQNFRKNPIRKSKPQKDVQPTVFTNRTMETIAANFSRLKENMNREKESRWKAERSVSELKRRLREETEEKNDLMKKIELLRKAETSTILSSNSNEIKILISDLEIEKQKSKSLQERMFHSEKSLSDLQLQLNDSERNTKQLEENLKREKENSSTLKGEKEGFEKLLKLSNQEHLAAMMALKKELEIWKQKDGSQKKKISELQALLLVKEKEMEGKTSKNSQELENYIQSRIDSAKNPFQLKMSELERSYAELEDEFREALKSEFTRFEKVKEAFLCSEHSLKECKKEIEEMRDGDQKKMKILAELNALVKEQKGRLRELTTAKQTQTSELKSHITTLEKELKAAQNDLEEGKNLRQERSILRARIESLESLVVGLKSEKRIWGEELAQQSSSLAQEKGKLESRVEFLQSSIMNLQRQLAKESEQNKISSKVINDQSDSLRKLKEQLLEKDEQIKDNNKKLLEMQSLAEKREEKGSREFSELMEELERCSSRKNELKDKWNAANKKLEEKENECRRMREELKRMNEEIKAIEKKVMKVADLKEENEHHLEEMKQSLLHKHEHEIQQLQDEHRKQLVSMETDAQVRLKIAERRVKEVEEEMRDLLKQREEERRSERLKVDKLTRVFQEFTGKELA